MHTFSAEVFQQESTIFPGYTRTVRFIVCENAYSLSTLAKTYLRMKPLYGDNLFAEEESTVDNGFRGFAGEDLYTKVCASIREWVLFFQQNAVLAEVSSTTSALEFCIVCSAVLNDHPYKRYIPYTDLYMLSKCESDIEQMMTDITEHVYGRGYYVYVLLPRPSVKKPVLDATSANDLYSIANRIISP